ncbi:hypothetical protein F443_02685 [Phytophthora nicotianae P1569]|uniref:Acetyl-CoA carboxylase central domain-containing protein n=3 Tax=Phytophthora nicotianae TaxID=4792 RepID=V9FSL8_PHYNI|nr:hypothetical protein F443_02685 [Phytophthora nicotianae P1569]
MEDKLFMVKLPSSENTNGNSIKSVHKMHKSLAVLKSVLQGPGHRKPFRRWLAVSRWTCSRRTKAASEEPTATHEFNVAEVAETLDEKKKTLDMDQKRSDFETSVLRLRDIARKYKHGLRSGEEAVLTDLINEYFTVETVYVNSHNIEDVVMALRQQIPSDLDKVFSIALSNKALESKNKLLLQLLAQMARGTPQDPGVGSGVIRATCLIESMETMNFNYIFVKTFQFKSPVIDALAGGVAPTESYDDLTRVLCDATAPPAR